MFKKRGGSETIIVDPVIRAKIFSSLLEVTVY